MNQKTRRAQTRVKHAILDGYLGAWMGIICNGLRRDAGRRWFRQPTFIYLDAFAGEGRFLRDEDDHDGGPVDGSPLLGAKALERNLRSGCRAPGLAPSVGSLMVEKDFYKFELLQEAIVSADLESPLHDPGDSGAYAWDMVNLRQDDVRNVIPGALQRLPDDHYLLAFIDPEGPVLWMESLLPLLNRPKTDLIVYFPRHQVVRDGGSALKSETDRTPTDRVNVDRTTRLFGTDEWVGIAREPDPAKKRRRYTELYRKQLSRAARRLFVKSIPLQFSRKGAMRSGDGPGYDLFLVTDHPDGALRMNEILRQAAIRKHWELWADVAAQEAKLKEETGALDLFAHIQPTPPEVEAWEFPPELAKHSVGEVLRKQGDVTFYELKAAMGETVITPGELSSALTALRRDGLVDYDGRPEKGTVIRWLK